MAAKNSALNKMNSFILVPPSCVRGWSIEFGLQLIAGLVADIGAGPTRDGRNG